MIRRNLLLASAFVVALVLSACSDVTGPQHTCQVVGGSQVCDGQ